MKTLAFLASLIATPAFAHVGHVADLAGHSHWVGIGALIGAGIIAGLLVKGKKAKPDPEPETEAEEQPA